MNKLKWTFQNSRLFSYSRCIASGGTEFVRGCDIHNQASCGNYYLMYAFCFGIRGGIVYLMLVIHSLATVWSSSINFFFIKNIFLLIGIFLQFWLEKFLIFRFPQRHILLQNLNDDFFQFVLPNLANHIISVCYETTYRGTVVLGRESCGRWYNLLCWF